jgi:hypothetical protein
MRSSADDPFLSFFQQSDSLLETKTKTFFDEKRKKNRPVFFSAHGCFFGKEPLQEYICIYPQKSFDI